MKSFYFLFLAVLASCNGKDINISSSTDAATAETVQVAGAPAGIKNFVSSASYLPSGLWDIHLSWEEDTSNVSFTVKKGVSSGVYTDVYSNVKSPFVISNLQGGTTQYFRVLVSAVVNETVVTVTSKEYSITIPTDPYTVKPAPFTMTATGGDQQVTLNWDSADRAVFYVIQSGTSSGSYPNFIARVDKGPYIDKNLTNGKSIYYMVIAVNSVGSTNATAEVQVTPMGLPGSFSSLTASPGDGTVTLSWASAENATKYIVKRSTVTGSESKVVIADNVSSPYTDTGLTNGTTYYYIVVAANDNGESNSSETSSTPMALPTSFTSSAIAGDTQVVLNWTSSAGATSYTVQYGTNTGSYPNSIPVSSSASSYTISGLTNGTTYYFRVIATNPSGSVNADEVSSFPYHTFNLTTNSQLTQIQLSWEASSGVDHYILKRSLTSNLADFVVIEDNLSSSTLSYNDTGTNGQNSIPGGIVFGTIYYYQVTAVFNLANQIDSNIAQGIETTAITDLSASLDNQGLNSRNVSLSWTIVANATNYHIFRSTDPVNSFAEIGSSVSGSYVDSSTQYGVKYYYKVDATTNLGDVHSNTVSVNLITYCQASIPLPSWEDDQCYQHHMFDTPQGCAADAFCQWGDHGAGLRCVSAVFTKSNAYCAQQGSNSCQPGWCSWIDGAVSTSMSNVTIGADGSLGTGTVGSAQTVTFHCKNSTGADVSNSCPGPVVFQLGNDGTSDGNFSDAVYNVNMATWTANFTATTAGTARSITAKYNGITITSTAPKFTVLASSNDLPVTHNLSLWLDASAANTVQDNSSAPVTNGNPVSNWLDRRLNGKFVTASSYANSGVPNYDTTPSSEAIVFNGPDGVNTEGQRLVGDLSLGGGDVFSTGPQTHTIFVVYDQNDLFYTSWPNLLRIGNPTTNENIAFHSADSLGNIFYYFFGNDIITSSYLFPYKNSRTLVTLRYDGSTRKLRVDSREFGSDTPGLSLNLQSDILEIGNYNRGGGPGFYAYYGKIHEMLFYNSGLDQATEVPQVEAYLRAKWNTP